MTHKISRHPKLNCMIKTLLTQNLTHHLSCNVYTAMLYCPLSKANFIIIASMNFISNKNCLFIFFTSFVILIAIDKWTNAEKEPLTYKLAALTQNESMIVYLFELSNNPNITKLIPP